MARVTVSVAVLVVAAYVLARVWLWLSSQWFLVIAARVLTGKHPRGKVLTDAGFLRKGTKALTASGHAPRYWHRPELHRMGINWSVLAFLFAVVWAEQVSPLATNACLAALTCTFIVFVIRALVLRHRRKTWLLPLHLAAHELAGHPRAALASSWIKDVAFGDDGAIRSVRLELTQGWPADTKDKERLVSIASAKLGIEAAEPSWRLAGPSPMVTLKHSEPPPDLVEYDDVADAVERAAPHELVVGLGKKGSAVKASLTTDSPHLAINMGTGGGKSTLAAFWLVQRLIRGDIAMVLDAKWFSHPWLFKDADGNEDLLPNVAYLSAPEEIHAGLMWLGAELARRNQVAKRAVDASGRLRGDVGPRIFVIAEELNYAMPDLKEYWAEVRDRDDVKKSPAVKGLSQVAFAGRAVKMHMVLIGQMLTAEVTGSRDSSVKENIGVTAIARYGQPGWNTAIGKNVPMPPSPSVLGRVQLVTASGTRETQTPKGDLLRYREMVLNGTITPCPPGMPGTRRVLGPERSIEGPASEQGLSYGTDAPPLGRGPVTLKEAADRHIVPVTLAALRKAQQRGQLPADAGWRGSARVWDAQALHDHYQAGRR